MPKTGEVVVGGLNAFVESALTDLQSARGIAELEEIRVRLLGRKGELTAQLKALGDMPPEQRAAAGIGQSIVEFRNA